ncbi:succinate dehydrogenase assembly factor 2 [Altererythrobacter sp. GH1-8]|uniref:FAD assembly factor SdhE n=1 Tax=Altererythrobacter sp. GH1-8 TaxID=3349333 RepID=UPI00374DBD63
MPEALTLDGRKQRCKFRAWHRGTREADFTIGGFFDRYQEEWGEVELRWFESLLEEDDVDILAWVFGTAEVPLRFRGELIAKMQQLDYVDIPR